MNKQTEIKKYEKKLSDLLNKCELYTQSNGKEYTPKKTFEDDYKLLINNPLKYFQDIEDSSDKENADDIRKIYIKAGSGAKGAYEVIKESIELLHQGTLFINDEVNNIKDFESELCNSVTPYAKINADNLLGLEQGLHESLETVREWLLSPYSADSDASVREVLNNGV